MNIFSTMYCSRYKTLSYNSLILVFNPIIAFISVAELSDKTFSAEELSVSIHNNISLSEGSVSLQDILFI